MTDVVISAPPAISVSVSTISPGGDAVECSVNETPIMVAVSSVGVQGPKGDAAQKKSEYLRGVIDGVNTEFLTTEIFSAGSTTITINGLIQPTDSYLEIPVEKKITFAIPPSNHVFTDVLFIHYLYQE